MSKENKTTSYLKAVNWCHNSFIYCGKLYEIDPYFELPMSLWNEEDEQFEEVYQFFLTDCNDRDVKFLTEHFSGIHFGYSDVLDMYILCVIHYGTGWDYVPVDVLNDDICDSVYEGIPDCI